MVYLPGAGSNRCTVDERILERCDHYDTGTCTSPTNHVIVLKCPDASKTGARLTTGDGTLWYCSFGFGTV